MITKCNYLLKLNRIIMKETIDYLLMSLLMLVGIKVHAQGGNIIYCDFNPNIVISEAYPSDTIKMDFDMDGSADVCSYFKFFSFGSRWCTLAPNNKKWEITTVANEVGDLSSDYSEIPSFGWTNEAGGMQPINDGGSFRYAVRMTEGDDYYYGWMKVYCVRFPQEQGNSIGNKEIVLDEMAFCTAPNYPLKWGQVSVDINEEYGDAEPVIIIYPNPSSDNIEIIGKELEQVEIVDVLGRQVFSMKGGSDNLQINICKLPSGLYFAKVTDSQGKKSVKKVIKN